MASLKRETIPCRHNTRNLLETGLSKKALELLEDALPWVFQVEPQRYKHYQSDPKQELVLYKEKCKELETDSK